MCYARYWRDGTLISGYNKFYGILQIATNPLGEKGLDAAVRATAVLHVFHLTLSIYSAFRSFKWPRECHSTLCACPTKRLIPVSSLQPGPQCFPGLSHRCVPSNFVHNHFLFEIRHETFYRLREQSIVIQHAHDMTNHLEIPQGSCR